MPESLHERARTTAIPVSSIPTIWKCAFGGTVRASDIACTRLLAVGDGICEAVALGEGEQTLDAIIDSINVGLLDSAEKQFPPPVVQRILELVKSKLIYAIVSHLEGQPTEASIDVASRLCAERGIDPEQGTFQWS